MERHAPLLPVLDQSPVHRAEQQMLPATTDERVFDFGEVAEVIQVFASLRASVEPLCLRWLPIVASPQRHRGSTESHGELLRSFVNQPQTFERQRLVHLLNKF